MRIPAISAFSVNHGKAASCPRDFYRQIPQIKQDSISFSGVKMPSSDEILAQLKAEPIDVAAARNKFIEKFGQKSEVAAFAPGRVEFAGNHIDNYGGYVIGFPTDAGVLTLTSYAEPGEDGKRLVTIYSEKFAKEKGEQYGTYTFDLNEDIGEAEKYYQENFGKGGKKEKFFWAKIAESTIRTLDEECYGQLRDMNILDKSNLPCTGISSSAAIEVSVANAVLKLHDIKMKREDIAFICKKAENISGTGCGILDQGTIAMAQGKDRGVLIHCKQTPTFENISMEIPGHKLVFIASGANHSNGSGTYNEFREGYNAGAKKLVSMVLPDAPRDANGEPNITRLCDITPQEYLLKKDEFESFAAEYNKTAPKGEQIDVKKTMHGIYDNQRVLKIVDALKEKDMPKLGALLTEAHISSRDNLRNSCEELDEIHAIALKNGALGGRLSGAGWGGGAFFIVPDEKLPEFVCAMREQYQVPKESADKETGSRVPKMFIFEANGGARLLDESVKKV